MAFGKGLAVGTISLLSNTVGGLAVSAGKVTGALGDKIAILSFDKKYQIKRRGSDVRGVKDGFRKGVRAAGRGIFDGITGVIASPIKGARDDGVSGFVKGVGQGLVGVAVKPVTGLLDFATYTSAGFKSKKEATFSARVRPPRSPSSSYPLLYI